ncbi:MAG: prepilin-type N-terminal cleavage/methylation domain-containing protein [Candidatus Staskawiczbacteria bacterium]|nr:prepilin-type N-terminal cleavage/methylation domain-containing protein [Candidatus Staskawiczbacteria bacterium]
MQLKLNSNFKFQISNSQRGFTLIELMVVLAIIVVLSSIILFSVTQYINKGKDANISANLAVLVPAGEIYYNGNSNSYEGFCTLQVVTRAKEQISSIVFCNAIQDEWMACAKEFTKPTYAFCVDSRNVKKEIPADDCSNDKLTQCP